MASIVCQIFDSATGGLGGGLGALQPQVLQNLQQPGGLGDNGKPDANSPSEFILSVIPFQVLLIYNYW